MTHPELSHDEFNRIAKYCAEEVRRQYAYQWEQEAPLRVAGMIEAWLDALHEDFERSPLSPDLIRRWGGMIEPRNHDFRKIPIFVGPYKKMDWRLIDSALGKLCVAINDLRLDAFEAYREFEEIHPFEDGNGRTGKIILNWINGTLIQPIFPPDNFWGKKAINP